MSRIGVSTSSRVPASVRQFRSQPDCLVDAYLRGKAGNVCEEFEYIEGGIFG